MKRIYKHDYLTEAAGTRVGHIEDILMECPEMHNVSGRYKSMKAEILKIVKKPAFSNIWEFKGNKCAESIMSVCDANNIEYITVDGRELSYLHNISELPNILPCHLIGERDVTEGVPTILIVRRFTSMSNEIFKEVAELLANRVSSNFELDSNIIPVAVSFMDEMNFMKYDSLPEEIRRNISTLSWAPQSDDNDYDDDLNDSYRPKKSTGINESAIINIATKATVDALRRINENDRWSSVNSDSVFKDVGDALKHIKTGGFLDCIEKLHIKPGGYGNQRIIDGNVYAFSLKRWKDAYDHLCDEKGDYITVAEYLNWLNDECLVSDINAEDSINRYKEYNIERDAELQERKYITELIKYNRAEFENACDYLYYGYGFNKWFKSCNGSINEKDAKLIWKAAIDKMGNED